MDELKDKTLVMIIGPSAIGKSSIMNAIVKSDERFSYVRSFTTRKRRRNDESSHYNFINENDITRFKATNQLVTFTASPTTGAQYGTVISSYKSSYSLLDTLANSVEQYRELPFKQTFALSLTAEPLTWKKWLLKRYPKHSDERTKRLNEALLSINWSLKQANDHTWFINIADQTRITANQIIQHIDNASAPDQQQAVAYAKAMRTIIEDLLLLNQK